MTTRAPLGVTFLLLWTTVARAQAPAATPAPVFPARAEQVTVDVVVTDKDGQPVPGLAREDFQIVEEGADQTIESFQAVHVPDAPVIAGAAAAARPAVSSNTTTPSPAERTFVIVFDNAHLSPLTIEPSRKAVQKFLDTGVSPGDRITVVPTGGGAWWTARMPEGCDDVMKALARLKGLRMPNTGSDFMSDWEAYRIYVGRDRAVGGQVQRRWTEDKVLVELLHNPRIGEAPPDGLGEGHPAVRAKAAELYAQLRDRRKATLRAVARAMDALRDVRGRKSVLLISEGFVHEPDAPEFRQVTHAARRANAALYFLDARGLSTGLAARGNAELNSLEQVESSNTSEMFYVTLDTTRLDVQGADTAAIDSGGFTLRNSNDLSVGMKRIASESRTYYLLGYTPKRTERDGKFRKISVEVKRPGVKVRARKGYFAPRDGEAPPAKEGDLDPEIRRALDAPFGEAGIPLRTAAYVFHDTEKGKVKVVLATEADPASFAFNTTGDRSEDTVEAFFLISSRDTGENFHQQTSLDLSLPADLRARLGVTWLPFLREFDLPAGVYQSRVLVREKNGAHAGVVTHDFEVPPLGALRISSPVLTDTMQVGSTPQAPPRPALIARRSFTQGGKLYCQFDVYGATPDPATNTPRVSAGHVLKRKDGPALANAEPTPLTPTAQGQLSRTLAVSLRPTLPGEYELILKVRDDVSGKTAQVTEPFTVEAAPGGVAPAGGMPGTAPEPRASDTVAEPTDAAGYLAAVEKYRTGDALVVAMFADGPRSTWDGARSTAVAGGACKSNCLRAAALLHTEAAARQQARGRGAEARAQLTLARELVELSARIEVGTDRQVMPADGGMQRSFHAAWLLAVGQLLQQAGDAREALRAYEESAKAAPSALALVGLGSVHEVTGGAMSGPQRRSAEAPPAGSESMQEFQRRAERERTERAAEEQYRAALALDPALSVAHLRLGRVLLEHGRLDDARRELAWVIDHPGDAESQHLAHLFLGELATQGKLWPAAVKQYRAALLVQPSSPARLALSHALLRSGERDAAREAARAAVADAGTDDPWLSYHLGLAARLPATLGELRERIAR